MIRLSPTETLHWEYTDLLDTWRAAHGEARERARYELRTRIIPDIRQDDVRRRAAFEAAVARSKGGTP